MLVSLCASNLTDTVSLQQVNSTCDQISKRRASWSGVGLGVDEGVVGLVQALFRFPQGERKSWLLVTHTAP